MGSAAPPFLTQVVLARLSAPSGGATAHADQTVFFSQPAPWQASAPGRGTSWKFDELGRSSAYPASRVFMHGPSQNSSAVQPVPDF